MKIPIKLYRCECGTDGIHVEYDEKYKEYDFCIWTQSDRYSLGPLTWYDRLRFCYQILKTGRPWGDSVILSEKNAEELSKDLLQHKNQKELLKG